MRQIEIYYDVDDNVLQDSNGNVINSRLYPFIYLEEQVLVQVQLTSRGVDYDKLTGTYTYSATISNTYEISNEGFCATSNSGINQTGDWKLGGNADITDGEISIRFNGYNQSFADLIDGNTTLNAFCEIQLRDSTSGNLEAVFEFPFKCKNLRNQTGITTTTTTT